MSAESLCAAMKNHGVGIQLEFARQIVEWMRRNAGNVGE
jgi:hypothetical protein